MKKLLILGLSVLLVNVIGVASASAQADKESQRAFKVKHDVEKIGIGDDVEVKLRDGTKTRGRISAIGDDQFIVSDKKGADTTIAFSDVKRVIKSEGSTGSQLKTLGLGAGLLAGVLALIVVFGRRDYVAR